MRITKYRLISGISAALLSVAPLATANVTTPITQVTYIQPYTQFGSGDVLFSTTTLASGCDGFWLAPSDPGFKQVLSTLEMAKAAENNLIVYADEHQIWSGSASRFCKVLLIQVQ